jgi:hypothetical protein
MRVNPYASYVVPVVEAIAQNTISHTEHQARVLTTAGPDVIIMLSREAREILERGQPC